tara:strand:+ start:141 stop:245 length:105 start_codon:yes stop_codon:yes gene_type:complete
MTVAAMLELWILGFATGVLALGLVLYWFAMIERD